MRPRKTKSHEPLHAQDLRRWMPERMTPRCVSLVIAALCFVQGRSHNATITGT